MKAQKVATILIVALCLLAGFDFSKHTIPLDEIQSGGPPKDGIPALDHPKFIAASEATFLGPTDRILGLNINGEAKAYPIAILNWHEVVNDTVGGKDVFVAYCPLCGTGTAFDAVIDGQTYSFGVSGLLYNSNVLFYDRQTESLWSQIKMEAVVGPLTGQKLELLPLGHTTWQAWREQHPNTKVLSTETGHRRDYGRNPYLDYAKTPRIMFPVANDDSRLPRKEWILGVLINGKAKAYPFSRIKTGQTQIDDQVGGVSIQITCDVANRSATVRDAQGNVIPSTQAYWFAWATFYPETELWS